MANKLPVAEAQMLIRKPAAVVFQAFIDPEITKNFWFTKASGKLQKGKTIAWHWEMYGISTDVFVKEMITDQQIIIEWNQPATTVEFNFTRQPDNTTYVLIKNYGFNLQGDELISTLLDSTGGFTTVLDGLKAWLEHNINLNLIADKFPKEVSRHGNK